MSQPPDPTANAGPPATFLPEVLRHSSMSVLLGVLERKGLEMFVDDGEVRYRGDEAALRTQEFAELRARRDEALEYLRNRALYEAIPPLTIGGVEVASALSTYQAAVLDCGLPAPRRSAQYRLRSELDSEKLQVALGEVLNRYEVLRSRFRLEDGAWRQTPLPARTFPVEVTDAAGDADADAAIEGFLREVRGCRLDIAAGEVLRAFALRLGEEDGVVAFVGHPAALDQRSWPVIAPQVFNRYFIGEPVPVKRSVDGQETSGERPPPAQMSDFVAWERQMIDAPGPGQGLAHWDERLAEAAPLFEGGGSGVRQKAPLEISSNLFLKISACARDYGLPPQAMVFGCYVAAFMHRLGRRCIALGYDVDNRPRGAEYLIGPLSSPRPFVLWASEADTFADLLTSARCAHLDAIDLRYPVAPEVLARTQLSRAVATVVSRPETLPKPAYTKFLRLPQRDDVSEATPSITVSFVQTPVELRSSLEFDPARLSVADAEWIIAATQALLGTGPGDPDLRVADLLAGVAGG